MWTDRVINEDVLNRTKENATLLIILIGQIIRGKRMLTIVLEDTVEGENKKGIGQLYLYFCTESKKAKDRNSWRQH